MSPALESQYQNKFRTDHHIFSWLVKHAGLLYNLCKVGEDGRTPYERRKGKRFNRVLLEIGECVWLLKPESEGRDKLNTRWLDGVFVGLREKSGELIVAKHEGAIKVTTFRWRPDGEQ